MHNIASIFLKYFHFLHEIYKYIFNLFRKNLISSGFIGSNALFIFMQNMQYAGIWTGEWVMADGQETFFLRKTVLREAVHGGMGNS